MSFDFDWQVREEDKTEEATSVQRKALFRRISWRRLLTIMVVCTVIGGSIWYGLQLLNQQAEADLVKAIAAYRTLEQQAVRAGNGELFRTALAPDPALLAAQFLPRNRAFNSADGTILSAKRKDDEIWTTVQWHDGDEALSRVVIYERDRGAFRRSRGTEYPWEQRYKVELPWGRIWLYEADLHWQLAIETFVGDLIEELCTDACPSEQLPLDIVIQRNFSEIAVDGWIHMPSPHLVGFKADGSVADAFWQKLRKRVVEQLMPASIHFAVPTELQGRFQAIAEQFQAKQGAVIVHIVSLGDFASDGEALAAVDGAFVMPTVAQITSGQIVDLSDYVATDLAFEPDDFFRRVWEAAVWQERVWAIPQAAKVRLIFYPKYTSTNPPEVVMPDSPMTAFRINELSVLRRREATERLHWDYIDAHNDILLALTMGKRCEDSIAGDSSRRFVGPNGPCNAAIDEETIVEMLMWYAQQVRRQETPNLPQLTAAERDVLQMNAASIPPRITFWIEDPAVYESYAERYELRVQPLTNESKSGVTPMHVRGSIISQQTEFPHAVWKWISFLSRQRPISPGRDLPARKSIKSQMRYFSLMPNGIRAQMELAIATARAVQIDEQRLFAWQILDDFLQERLSANEAAKRMVDQQWSTGQ